MSQGTVSWWNTILRTGRPSQWYCHYIVCHMCIGKRYIKSCKRCWTVEVLTHNREIVCTYFASSKEGPVPDTRVHYRYLNNMTETNTYPKSRVDDTVDELRAAKYITALDLTRVYWQVEDHAKAAFVKQLSLYYHSKLYSLAWKENLQRVNIWWTRW